MDLSLHLPEQFVHRDQNSDDPVTRVAALDWIIAQGVEWETRLQTLLDTLAAELNTLEIAARKKYDSHFDQEERENIKASMRQILTGFSPLNGITDDRLQFMVNLPGLNRTREILTLIREEREVWAPRIGVDMSATARYRLKKGKRHFADGRQYYGGDVLELTLNQYKNFADKFDPAPDAKTRDEPLTVSKPKQATPAHSSEREMAGKYKHVGD